MIIAGYFGGRLTRLIKFPMITGYIIVGILLSPSVSNIFSSTTVDDLNMFTSVALGIIAYAIGGRLHLKTIHKMERSILLIGVLQAIGALIMSVAAIILAAPFLLDIPEATFINAYLPIGLGLLAERVLSSLGTIIYNGILSSVIINELIAPPLVKYAIFKAREQRAG